MRSLFVMRGLAPRIHVFPSCIAESKTCPRTKRGHDSVPRLRRDSNRKDSRLRSTPLSTCHLFVARVSSNMATSTKRGLCADSHSMAFSSDTDYSGYNVLRQFVSRLDGASANDPAPSTRQASEAPPPKKKKHPSNPGPRGTGAKPARFGAHVATAEGSPSSHATDTPRIAAKSGANGGKASRTPAPGLASVYKPKASSGKSDPSQHQQKWGQPVSAGERSGALKELLDGPQPVGKRGQHRSGSGQVQTKPQPGQGRSGLYAVLDHDFSHDRPVRRSSVHHGHGKPKMQLARVEHDPDMDKLNAAYIKNPALLDGEEQWPWKTINQFLQENRAHPERVYKIIDRLSPALAEAVKKQALWAFNHDPDMDRLNAAYVKNPALLDGEEQWPWKTINQFLQENRAHPERVYKIIDTLAPDLADAVRKQAFLVAARAKNNDVIAIRALKPQDLNDKAKRQLIDRFVMQNEPRQIDLVVKTLPRQVAQAVKLRALAINKIYADYQANLLAAWVKEPLTKPEEVPQANVNEVMARLEQATKDASPEFAAAVVKQALGGDGGLEAFYKRHESDLRNDELFVQASAGFGDGPGGNPTVSMTPFMNIADHLAGMREGDAMVSRLVAMGGWPKWPGGRYISRAIGHGAGLAYPLEAARQIGKKGGDPGPVYTAIDKGILLFKAKIDADVRKLGEHNQELYWLIKNDGPGMTPEKLDIAVKNYLNDKGEKWQAEDANLRKRIAADGVKLLHYGIALGKISASKAHNDRVEQALRSIADDSAAAAAISMAIQKNPIFTKNPLFETTVRFLQSPYFAAKATDVARKLLGELATSVFRHRVLEKIGGLNLLDPAGAAQANAALTELAGDHSFTGALLGHDVSQKQIDAAFEELKQFNNNIAVKNLRALQTAALDEEALRAEALKKLNQKLTVKGFALHTPAGIFFRAAASAFAAIGFYGKLQTAAGSPRALNIAKAVDAGVSFAARTGGLAHSLGLVEETSAVAKLGGAWKIVRGVTVSGLTDGASAVFDGIDGSILLARGDSLGAGFAFTRAVGGGLSLGPALGAASWTGPVGFGLIFAGVVGNEVYHDAKDAHKYEEASRKFLIAGGYDPAAAATLSRRVDFPSGYAGTAQIPLLARYAEFKKIDLQKWINELSQRSGQIELLSETVLGALNEGQGDPCAHLNQSVEDARQTREQQTTDPQKTEAQRQFLDFGIFDHMLDKAGIAHPLGDGISYS